MSSRIGMYDSLKPVVLVGDLKGNVSTSFGVGLVFLDSRTYYSHLFSFSLPSHLDGLLLLVLESLLIPSTPFVVA